MRETTTEQRNLLETKTPLVLAAIEVDAAICDVALVGAGPMPADAELRMDRALSAAREKLDDAQRAWSRYWQSRRAA